MRVGAWWGAACFAAGLAAGSGAWAEGERAGDFDLYVMALSWSANWCALEGDGRDDPQCDAGRGLTFVLHDVQLRTMERRRDHPAAAGLSRIAHDTFLSHIGCVT